MLILISFPFFFLSNITYYFFFQTSNVHYVNINGKESRMDYRN